MTGAVGVTVRAVREELLIECCSAERSIDHLDVTALAMIINAEIGIAGITAVVEGDPLATKAIDKRVLKYLDGL